MQEKKYGKQNIYVLYLFIYGTYTRKNVYKDIILYSPQRWDVMLSDSGEYNLAMTCGAYIQKMRAKGI